MNASGSATSAAPIVPRNAIRIVSKIAQTTSLCRHIWLFQTSCTIAPRFDRSGTTRSDDRASPANAPSDLP